MAMDLVLVLKWVKALKDARSMYSISLFTGYDVEHCFIVK